MARHGHARRRHRYLGATPTRALSEATEIWLDTLCLLAACAPQTAVAELVVPGADPGFVESGGGAQRLPQAPQARRFLEGPV